ncbi:MAG: cytochrome-c peroxidase [Planctomycetia bacterium]
MRHRRLLLVLLPALALLAARSGRPGPAEAAPVGPAQRPAEAVVELGRRLFYDPAVSRSQARSCAACHDPEHGFGDPSPRSQDDVATTRRHSQSLVDVALAPRVHWDGEFDTLEDLVHARLGPVAGTRGMAGGRSLRAPSLGAHGPLAELGLPALAGLPSRASGGNPYAPTPRAPSDPTPAPTAPGEPQDPVPERPEDRVVTPADGALTPGGRAREGEEEAGEQVDGDGRAALRARARQQDEAQRAARRLPIDLARVAQVEETLQAAGRYDEAFVAAFGSRTVATARLVEALAAYMRSIRSGEAPFDRWLAGKAEAMDASAVRGLELFRGRAGCTACHSMAGGRPTFSDQEFHNTGIAWSGHNVGAGAREQLDLDKLAGSDRGREALSGSSKDRRAFRTPTLRDVVRHPPYMHDGSFRTLEGVVRYYAAGGSRDDKQDPALRRFAASEQDVADLVAFLHALKSYDAPGQAARAWPARAARQRVRLVDAQRQPLAGWEVRVQAAGELLPLPDGLAGERVLLTDAQGVVELPRSPRTHWRVALPEGLEPAGGSLVPDTCAEATLVVPVDGRWSLAVTFGSGVAAPEVLVAEHRLELRWPGLGLPRTQLLRVGRPVGTDGRETALYEGWQRADLPPEVTVRLPGDAEGEGHPLRVSGTRALRLDASR